MRRYQGLIAAPHSPFDAAGDLNPAAVDGQAAVLAETGVVAVFPCGSTGESHSLTLDDRRRLARRWVEAAGKSMDVIVHVGHNCQRDAAALAAHAQEVGAAAVAAMAPCYYRPGSVDDLVDFLAPVAAAAPALPFYFYDIPALTGVRLPMDQFLTRAARRMPNLAGIKYTSDDLMTLQSCLALDGGRYDILFGCDEILLSALALGARGAVGSTYNYAAPLYRRILRAFETGDLEAARAEQRKSVALVQVLVRFGVLRAGKAVVGMLGVDCGPVRPPVRPLTAEETSELYRALVPLDIFSRPLREPAR